MLTVMLRQSPLTVPITKVYLFWLTSVSDAASIFRKTHHGAVTISSTPLSASAWLLRTQRWFTSRRCLTTQRRFTLCFELLASLCLANVSLLQKWIAEYQMIRGSLYECRAIGLPTISIDHLVCSQCQHNIPSSDRSAAEPLYKHERTLHSYLGARAKAHLPIATTYCFIAFKIFAP